MHIPPTIFFLSHRFLLVKIFVHVGVITDILHIQELKQESWGGGKVKQKEVMALYNYTISSEIIQQS